MITLAVEQLVDSVAATFLADAGKISILETANFTGAAALTGAATDFAEVEIRFTTGGTVGAPGIIYDVSTDDGLTRGSPTALGAATTITVAGVTATISGAVATGNALRWQQNSPVMPVFAFGTRGPAQRGEQYRIVWVPGDEEDAGEVSEARLPGRNPRPLYTFEELLTAYVEASDFSGTSAEVERKQWRAARLLLNALLRAVYKATTARTKIDAVQVLNDRSTRRHGWAYRVTFRLEAMVPDEAFAAAPASDASVTTDAQVLGVTIQSDGPDVVAPGE